MARPRKWFNIRERSEAFLFAKERGLDVIYFDKRRWDGTRIEGYYVGKYTKPPCRLQLSCVRCNKIRLRESGKILFGRTLVSTRAPNILRRKKLVNYDVDIITQKIAQQILSKLFSVANTNIKEVAQEKPAAPSFPIDPDDWAARFASGEFDDV